MVELIDAHHHLWRYNRADYGWIDDSMDVLRRDFTAADLVCEIDSAGIAGTIAVQARQTIAETSWLLDCAERTPQILGVVGWVPLTSGHLHAELKRLRGKPLLKGVRHVVQNEPDGFLLDDAFNRGIAALLDEGLTYDILIYEKQLPQAIDFVSRHPQQKFILDHLAKPRVAEGQLEPWRSNLFKIAACGNVFCKVSGLVNEADWSQWNAAGLEPFLDVALEAFGPERLLAGSDWPVCLVASSYKRWWSTLSEWALRLPPDQRLAFLGGNARQVYAIDETNRSAEHSLVGLLAEDA